MGSAVAPTVSEASRERWVRHPADLARFAFTAFIAFVVALLTVLDPKAARNISNSVIDLVNYLPGPVASGIIGLTQFLALAVPLAVVVSLALARRWRVIGVLMLAAVLAAVTMAMLNGVLEDSVPAEAVRNKNVDSWFFGAAFPSSAYLGAVVAGIVAGAPWMPRSWRPLAWAGVAALCVSRLVTAVEVPVHLVEVLVLGAAAGSAALLITGAPRRRVDSRRVMGALADGGIVVSELVRLDPDSTVPTFRANGEDGDLYVKALGREQRDADLLFRVWRVLTRKGLGDAVPAASVRGFAEQEALALSLAGAAGVACPRPRGLSATADDVVVLATDWADDPSLTSVNGGSGITDEMLRAAWRQVATLRRHRLAHRALSADNVRTGASGATLTSFDRAQIAAEDHGLAVDVAELLCSTAVLVGPDRAVAAARAELPREALADALPLLQPAVLTSATRKAVKGRDDLMEELRAATQSAAEVEAFELAKVSRVSLRGIVSLVGSAVLGYYLLSLVSNWSETWDTLQQTDWSYIPWLLVLMVATYLGGALSLMGAVRTDLPFVTTSQVMFAQSFLNRFTPANAGGMALRARYLQLQGEDLTVAAGSVGLTSAVSGVLQAVYLLVFVFWAGTTDELSNVSAPGWGIVLLVVVAVAAIIGFVTLSGRAQRVVLPWVKRSFGKIFESLRDLAKQPRKMVQLWGGSAAAKLATVSAFYVSVVALGEGMSFAEAGSIYMVGATIGAAVPTPGGVGGIEAALTALLVSAGVDNPTAVSIVLLFRLITFWLPTIPGWFFLQYVQRRKIV